MYGSRFGDLFDAMISVGVSSTLLTIVDGTQTASLNVVPDGDQTVIDRANVLLTQNGYRLVTPWSGEPVADVAAGARVAAVVDEPSRCSCLVRGSRDIIYDRFCLDHKTGPEPRWRSDWAAVFEDIGQELVWQHDRKRFPAGDGPGLAFLGHTAAQLADILRQPLVAVRPPFHPEPWTSVVADRATDTRAGSLLAASLLAAARVNDPQVDALRQTLLDVAEQATAWIIDLDKREEGKRS